MKYQLIFVYNTSSGLWNWVTDYARKSIDPDSYKCNLCKVIAGNGLTIKKPWKDFINSLKIPSKFMYLDEFQTAFPDVATEAPVVFIVDDSNNIPQLLIANTEINTAQTLDELIELVTLKTNQLCP